MWRVCMRVLRLLLGIITVYELIALVEQTATSAATPQSQVNQRGATGTEMEQPPVHWTMTPQRPVLTS